MAWPGVALAAATAKNEDMPRLYRRLYAPPPPLALPHLPSPSATPAAALTCAHACLPTKGWGTTSENNLLHTHISCVYVCMYINAAFLDRSTTYTQ